jgi:hypothetical protein
MSGTFTDWGIWVISIWINTWGIFEFFFFDKRYLWFNWWFDDSQIIFEAMDRNQTTMKQEISFDLKNKSVLTPKGTSVWLVLMQINENHIYSYSYVTSFLKQWPNFSLFLINYISCGCYILVKLQSKYNKNNEIIYGLSILAYINQFYTIMRLFYFATSSYHLF